MNQTPERRNDVGFKAVFTTLTGVIGVLLALFAHAAWSTASEGNTKASRNEVKIATMEECLRNMSGNLAEIKDILKAKYNP